MTQVCQRNNSINELLEIFKHLRDDNNKESQLFNASSFTSTEPLPQPRDTLLQPFSFYKSNKRPQFGLYSSLERPNNYNKPSNFTSRTGTQQENSIFARLYQQDQALKSKRERLIEEGRRSLQAKQAKECTFSPNRGTRLNTARERSCSAEESDAFYQRNLEWQSKRALAIRRKQCDKNSQSKEQFTFAPKINGVPPRSRENKENQGCPSARKASSYLQKYQSGKQDPSSQKQVGPSVRPGYFSYAR